MIDMSLSLGEKVRGEKDYSQFPCNSMYKFLQGYPREILFGEARCSSIPGPFEDNISGYRREADSYQR